MCKHAQAVSQINLQFYVYDDLGLRQMNGLKIKSVNPTVNDSEIRILHDGYNC